MPVRLKIGTGSKVRISSAIRRRVLWYEVPEQNFSGTADACLFKDMSEVTFSPGYPTSGFMLTYDVPTTFYIFEDPETGDEYICDEGGKERLELAYR